MQVTQAEDPNFKRVGVEEEYIKFRPSPNFKNMKKFLKNRSNHHSVTPDPEQGEKLNRKEIKPVIVQPPLPPYPPPPDSPINIVIKQEREDDDDDSQSSSGGEGDMTQEIKASEEQTAEQTPEKTEERPKKTICKEFIRGNCKRPLCKYAHEIDVSQLAGVFTFCWNYQNAVCTFPNCRFVHASVFEEAEFYRTGVLPPHARSHLKKPSPPVSEDSQQEMRPSNFTNPPPSVHPNVDKPLSIINCVPATAIEQRPEDDIRNMIPRSVSPLKREWVEIEEFSSSPRELEVSEHLVKKCKNCDIQEFSLKCNKEMIENISQSTNDVNKKIGQITKKNTKLLNVLFTILKPSNSNKTTAVSNGLINADKEKALLEQLNNFMGTNNRLSSVIISDDSIKNVMAGNINLSSLMAKILCSASEQTMPGESSREA